MAYAFNDDKSKTNLTDLFKVVSFKNFSSATVKAGDAIGFVMSGDASKVMGIRRFNVTGTGASAVNLGITKIDYGTSSSGVYMIALVRNFGSADMIVPINGVTIEAMVAND